MPLSDVDQLIPLLYEVGHVGTVVVTGTVGVLTHSAIERDSGLIDGVVDLEERRTVAARSGDEATFFRFRVVLVDDAVRVLLGLWDPLGGLSVEVTSSPPYSLAFARSLRVGLPVSTTRCAGTELVSAGSAVSAGVDSGQPVPTRLKPRMRML